MTTSLAVLELLAKCGVAAVLLASGVAKLWSEPDVSDQRLPAVLGLLDRRTGRHVLGATEIGLSSASVLALGSPYVDVAVAALCAAFLGGSAVLARTRPGALCQCFGAASRSVFGPRHTALTAALFVGATGAMLGALAHSDDPSWSWHPLMIVTLLGLLILAARVRPAADLTRRRSS